MWWLSATAHATTCDASAIEDLSARLSSAPAGQRLVLAATAWSELCTDDGVLDAQLQQVSEARPENHWVVEMQTGVLDAWRWNKACPGGSLALNMATKLGPAQRRSHLWKTCDLARLSLFEPAEWEEGQGLMVLPVLVAWTLADAGVPAERARPIVRALAGTQ